jgi:hypothetical protein
MTGVVLVVAGWAVLLRGLFILAPSDDPLADLDAGASFGINSEVYIPAIALTVGLLVAIPVVLLTRPGSVIGIGACVAAVGFAMWVLSQQELLNYIPGLDSAVRLAASLSVTSLLVFVVETRLRRPVSAIPA